MRRVSILAVLALLALIAVPIADAAVSKPSMTVEGNVQVVFAADESLTGLFRFEIRTTETGKVEFGYYQTRTLTGWWAGGQSQATVETIKFLTATNGGRSAEFTGEECGPVDVANPASEWACAPYMVRVTDNAGKGVPDVLCGGPVGGDCPFAFSVTGGDIRIFSRQQQ